MDNLCVMCGNPRGKNKYCCSKKCLSAYRTQWKICVVCGKSFPDPQSNRTICCSPKCSRINRQRTAPKDKFEKMIQAKQQFYDEHNGENNINSKYWVIQSPEGTVYGCQNLMHFLRTNQELYEGTPRQAMTGFAHIKATVLGKRTKNRTYSWKGWKLISWSDEVLGEKMRKEKEEAFFQGD